MFDTNALLEMLNNGQSVDALAKGFTDALNAAIDQKRKEEELAEAAAQKAAREADRRACLEDMIYDAYCWLAEYYPELEINADEISAKDVEAMADKVEELIASVVPLVKMAHELDKISPAPSDEDVFNQWFKSLGL